MEQDYGTANVAGIQIKITDFFQMDFINGRHISAFSLEDGTFCLSVENPESSGRSNQTMRLSKESFIGLGVVYNFYLTKKWPEGLNELLKSLTTTDNFSYSHSDNLKNDIP